jgi:predicted transcriptional regulator
MRIVLARGPITVREVTDALAREREHPPAYTTVMTIMSRLHERGLLNRDREGRGFRYRAAADEQATIDELSRRAVDRLLETYGTSAMRHFAVQLGDLDEAQRDELLRLAQGGKEEPRRPA